MKHTAANAKYVLKVTISTSLCIQQNLQHKLPTRNLVKTRSALLVPDSRSTCCSFGLLLLLETESQALTQPNSNLQLLEAAPEKTRGAGGWGGGWSNLCERFDVILSSKHRQRINWQEDQPGP